MKHRNAAVALLLADLREELLSSPSSSLAAEHIAMMRFEEQVASPRASRPRATAVRSFRPAPGTLRGRVLNAASTRPRRFAALFAAICVLSGSVGLDAAGAVPAAVRQITEHITDTIVHTFGVPQAPAPSSAGAPARAGSSHVIDGQRPVTSVASSTPESSAAASTTVSASTGAPEVGAQGAPASESTAVTPDDPSSPSQSPPAQEPPTGEHRPPKHNMGKDPNTPPGLPSDWSTRAVTAARTQLTACALATDLAPAGCPQVATVDAGVTPQNVQWTLLNQPLAGATATARANGIARQATISVYGLFQMEATYTVGTDAQPHVAYSSGIARATMTWDGTTLLAVTFTSGSVAGQLPDGVHVPAFDRPVSATDGAVLAALQSGFAAWATNARGTLVGDPTQGAVVSFDPAHGNLTVTGTYTLASSDPSGTAVTRPFTALLVANDTVVQLLSITGT